MNRIAAFALAATIGLGSMTAMADDNVKKNDAARDKQPVCCLQGIILTEKQKAEIAALQASRQKELQARRDQRDKDRQQKAGMRQTERKNYLAEMKKILTPEQYVQMLETILSMAGPCVPTVVSLTRIVKTARTRTARMTACVAPIVSRPMGQQLHRVKVWLCEAGDGDE